MLGIGIYDPLIALGIPPDALRQPRWAESEDIMTSQPSLNATREIARYLVSYLASRQWTLATIEASLPSAWRLVGVEESDFQPLTIGHVARVLHTHVQIAR